MSVESPEALERSVLERKDREQLLAIAAAIGVKATSRAKKAEIIDKILTQTGHEEQSTTTPSEPPRPRANGRSKGAKDVETTDEVPGNQEAPGYAVVLIDESNVVVHQHDFLYSGERFWL